MEARQPPGSLSMNFYRGSLHLLSAFTVCCSPKACPSDSLLYFRGLRPENPSALRHLSVSVPRFRLGPIPRLVAIPYCSSLSFPIWPPLVGTSRLGDISCRNVAKRGHFYSRRMGIIIVARHIQFSRCPEGIQHSRHRAIHPRHQCRGFSRWIGNFRESRLNQLASPQTASKTPNATSHFGKSPISPAEIESSTDPGGRSNLRRRKGARRRNRAPLILFCTRAAGVRSYKPSA